MCCSFLAGRLRDSAQGGGPLFLVWFGKVSLSIPASPEVLNSVLFAVRLTRSDYRRIPQPRLVDRYRSRSTLVGDKNRWFSLVMPVVPSPASPLPSSPIVSLIPNSLPQSGPDEICNRPDAHSANRRTFPHRLRPDSSQLPRISRFPIRSS